MSGMKLTAKQQAWIDYYKQGHTATEAARLAGIRRKAITAFKASVRKTCGNLRNMSKTGNPCWKCQGLPIWRRSTPFWTDIMRSEEQDPKDRLKASELRARAAGGFIEKGAGKRQP